jgi:3-isopropylmalate dehydrogenase
MKPRAGGRSRRHADGRGRPAGVRQRAAGEAAEKGLLGIRKALGVYANLRPVRTYRALLDSSPLKNDLVEGTT